MFTEIVTLPYKPRNYQLSLHKRLKRFNVLVCHRRFGKTVFCINELVKQALEDTSGNGRYAYIAPQLKQAKQISWDYLKEFTQGVPGRVIRESELRIDFQNGSRIRLYGADNPDALRGIYLDYAVLDEYAQMPPNLWTEVLRPALSDRLGGAIFIGTPKGRNAFYEIYDTMTKMMIAGSDDHYTITLRNSDTKIVPQSEIDSARLTGMSDEEIEQEFECSFSAAIVGSFYGKTIDAIEKDGQIAAVPYDANKLVYTAWDLGWSDSTAIWFAQQHGNRVDIIDYYEASGADLPHFAEVLEKKRYRYKEHILPHDAKVHELGTGESRLTQLEKLGLRCVIAPKYRLDDGINAARALLNRCWFDKDKCEKGLECLRNYQRQWDIQAKVFKRSPRHDWTSHGADAFRYLATCLKEDDDIVRSRIQSQNVVIKRDWNVV